MSEQDVCFVCGAERFKCEYRTFHLFDKEARKKCAEKINSEDRY